MFHEQCFSGAKNFYLISLLHGHMISRCWPSAIINLLNMLTALLYIKAKIYQKFIHNKLLSKLKYMRAYFTKLKKIVELFERPFTVFCSFDAFYLEFFIQKLFLFCLHFSLGFRIRADCMFTLHNFFSRFNKKKSRKMCSS